MWLRFLYPTPKLDVRAVVVQKGQLLLVREAADGRWSLPGGWVDRGDSLSRAAEREVREESGYDVRAVKVLSVSNVDRKPGGRSMRVNIFRLLVRCELVSPEAQAIQGAETTEARFFNIQDLPELSATRVRPADIDRILQHHADPSRFADCDSGRRRPTGFCGIVAATDMGGRGSPTSAGSRRCERSERAKERARGRTMGSPALTSRLFLPCTCR
jgi:ADP-ribose pyrophosphatase YjhB (NUDIX family)